MRAWWWVLGLGCALTAAAAEPDKLVKLKREQAALAAEEARFVDQLNALLAEVERLDKERLAALRALRRAKKELAEAERRLAKARQERAQAQKRLRRAEAELAWLAQAFWRHQAELSPAVWLKQDPTRGLHRAWLAGRVAAWLREEYERWQKAHEALAKAEAQYKEAAERHRRVLAERRKAYRRWQRLVARKRKAVAQLRRKVAHVRARRKAVERALAQLEEAIAALGEAAVVELTPPKRGALVWPLQGRVVRRFGERVPPFNRPLDGIWIAPARDRTVRAAAAGQVRYADWLAGMGLVVVIDHGHGLMSVYAHNDALLVRRGDWVEQGEPIAEAGSTGLVSDLRLYFGLRLRRKPVDPLSWLASR